jgi:drug/metabolite transporter superfamily protein YnfA
MDISCPSLPPKIFVAVEVAPNEQTTRYMAAHGCHFIVCSLFVLRFSIELFSLTVRDQSFARIVLYKASPAIVSRLFS